MKKTLLGLTLLTGMIFAQEERVRIMRPVDGAAISQGKLRIVARGPSGKLELDGQVLQTQEPFPNVFHATVEPSPGEHTLKLLYDGGEREIHFFVGANAPAKFAPFKAHPPIQIDCTHCHGLSRRGRFQFQGGCFACHQEEAFKSIHEHESHVLQECGQCHNAHGSTAKALLTLPKKQACMLCHG